MRQCVAQRSTLLEASPYTFTATGLPKGLTLNASGAISGAPKQAGTFTISVKATDSTPMADGGPFYSKTKTLSLTVDKPNIAVKASLPPAEVKKSYGGTLTASGGTAPYTFTVTGLPAGLSVHGNGVISGTPMKDGTFTITVTATDSTRGADGGPFHSKSKTFHLVVAKSNPVSS